MTKEVNGSNQGIGISSLRKAWNDFDRKLDRFYVDSGMEKTVQYGIYYFNIAKLRTTTFFQSAKSFIEKYPMSTAVATSVVVSVLGTALIMVRYQRNVMRNQFAHMEKQSTERFQKLADIISDLSLHTEDGLQALNRRFEKGFTLHQTARPL